MPLAKGAAGQIKVRYLWAQSCSVCKRIAVASLPRHVPDEFRRDPVDLALAAIMFGVILVAFSKEVLNG